jgi:hypothetical protein
LLGTVKQLLHYVIGDVPDQTRSGGKKEPHHDLDLG